MRLLICTVDDEQADEICRQLDLRGLCWDIMVTGDGAQALKWLFEERFDLLLIHACLKRMDGVSVLNALAQSKPICPPRVLLMCERELLTANDLRTDCVVPISARATQLCKLLEVLSKKSLPMLAAAQKEQISTAVDRFLNALSLRPELKGRTYAAWMLNRVIPSSSGEDEPMGALYAACARAYRTTPAAVERCLRVAIESVFTQGSMRGIEHFFGATVDPERGKPTNRAFLLQATQQIRQGLCPKGYALDP